MLSHLIKSPFYLLYIPFWIANIIEAQILSPAGDWHKTPRKPRR